jgi:hypothetical protein
VPYVGRVTWVIGVPSHYRWAGQDRYQGRSGLKGTIAAFSPVQRSIDTIRRPCNWNPSSVVRRLAVASVWLVPSPVGLGRDGIALETARDEEFLCSADELAFTEEVRGGPSCGVHVAQLLEHLCLIHPDERGRRLASRRRA